MKKILAFGASNSTASINKQFATYASSLIDDAKINLIDLNDFDMPIFGVDREKRDGIPEAAHRFKQMIKEADGIIISFAEHNGSYSVAFKNLYDWTSRIEPDMWHDKPMFLLATSPGGRGGKSVLDAAISRISNTTKCPLFTFSLPFFEKNFSETDGILDSALNDAFQSSLIDFQGSLE